MPKGISSPSGAATAIRAALLRYELERTRQSGFTAVVQFARDDPERASPPQRLLSEAYAPALGKCQGVVPIVSRNESANVACDIGQHFE